MPPEADRHRFSVEDYHRMAEAGILTEDDRVELLRGEIVVMAPIGRRHVAAVNLLNHLFSSLGPAVICSVQNPVLLADSEPEPDFVLLRPRRDFYAGALPGGPDVLLVVEVAETSHLNDRERKAPIYAERGIPEYWLIDLVEDRIEVRRRPGPDGYEDIHLVSPGETISPQAFPDFALGVADLIPARA